MRHSNSRRRRTLSFAFKSGRHPNTHVRRHVFSSSRRSQRISPSPEPQLITAIHRLSPPKAMDIRSFQAAPTQSMGETSPLDLSKHTPPPSDPLVLATGDHDTSSSQSSTSTLIPKKNLSTSDLDPVERKKQSALTKVQAKLDKAQRLYQSAQQSVEQNISEFLSRDDHPGHRQRTVVVENDQRRVRQTHSHLAGDEKGAREEDSPLPGGSRSNPGRRYSQSILVVERTFSPRSRVACRAERRRIVRRTTSRSNQRSRSKFTSRTAIHHNRLEQHPIRTSRRTLRIVTRWTRCDHPHQIPSVTKSAIPNSTSIPPVRNLRTSPIRPALNF